MMEPMTLPCAVQVMQLAPCTPIQISVESVQTEEVASPASYTTTGKRPAAGWGEAESEAARARPNPSRWRRRLAKTDGRCAVRSTLYGAGHPLPETVADILTEDSVAAYAFIREIRRQSAQALKVAMDEDETLQMIVGADFPDEQYADFDEWATAMASDDTDAPTSPLWHGGGQWLLYGLGLLLRCQIVITSLYPDLVSGTGFVDGATQEVVLAGERVVRLAMLHDDDGCPDHFDVFAEASPPSSPRASPRTPPRASPPQLPPMVLADAVRPAQGGVVERMPSLSSQPSSDNSGSESPPPSPPSSALRRLWEAPEESPVVSRPALDPTRREADRGLCAGAVPHGSADEDLFTMC